MVKEICLIQTKTKVNVVKALSALFFYLIGKYLVSY